MTYPKKKNTGSFVASALCNQYYSQCITSDLKKKLYGVGLQNSYFTTSYVTRATFAAAELHNIIMSQHTL